MAEDRRPDRPGDKADEIGAEGQEGCRQRLEGGKEKLAKYQPGRGAIEEEVVPFDGGADGGGEDRLAQLDVMVHCGCVQRCCDHADPRLRHYPASTAI